MRAKDKKENNVLGWLSCRVVDCDEKNVGRSLSRDELYGTYKSSSTLRSS